MPIPVVVLPSAPDLPEIVPPVLFPPTVVFAPSPVTVSPPELPVLSRMIPSAEPPLELMLPTVSPLAPIVVLATLSAVPVVVVSVLVVPVTVTVPPPVAVKAPLAPVERVTPPVKVIVEPVLFVSETPAPEVTLSVPAWVIVVPLTLLDTEKAVPAPDVFEIELPVGARNWPPTLERLRPPAAVTLVRSARRRSIVALVMSRAAPLAALIVLVPTPSGVAGVTLNVRPLLVPVAASAVPLAAKMSRSSKKRLPWLVVTASPAPPTGLPETPMGRLPPLSCWMPAVRLRLRGPPARADDRRVRDPRA